MSPPSHGLEESDHEDGPVDFIQETGKTPTLELGSELPIGIWQQLGVETLVTASRGRGRAIKGVNVPCADLNDMEDKFSKFMQLCDAANQDERIVELVFNQRAPFSVARLQLFDDNCVQPLKEDGTPSLPDLGNFEDTQDAPPEVILTVGQALGKMRETQDTVRRQRQLAKSCMRTIESIDTYRYALHSTWRAVPEAAYRFSYYCCDSTANKDRVANGRKRALNKRKTPGTNRTGRNLKPTYDCKGSVSVKFDPDKETMTVVYRHRNIHAPYEPYVSEANGGNIGAIDIIPGQEKRKRDSNVAEMSAEAALRQQSLSSLLLLMRDEGSAASPAQPQMGTFAVTSATRQVSNQRSAQKDDAQDDSAVQHHDDGTPLTARHGPHLWRGGACIPCRHRRTKCNGARPTCSTCITRKQDCSYDKAIPPPPPPGLARLNAANAQMVARTRADPPAVEAMAGTQSSELVRANTKLNLQSARNQALAADLEKHRDELELLQADHDALTTDHAALKKKNLELMSKVRTLEGKVMLADARNAELKAQVETLEADTQVNSRASTGAKARTSTGIRAPVANMSRQPLAVQHTVYDTPDPPGTANSGYGTPYGGNTAQPYYTTAPGQVNRANPSSAKSPWVSDHSYAPPGRAADLYWTNTR